MFGLGVGEILTGLLIFKSVATVAWEEYKKGQQAFLKIRGQAQAQTAKNLSDALGKLVARGKNKGIDSYELYRNLEKLLPLLCRDASLRRVKDQVYNLSRKIVQAQFSALSRGVDEIERDYPWNLRMSLLWDPECAEVFEATKGEMEFNVRTMVEKLADQRNLLESSLEGEILWSPHLFRLPVPKARVDAEQVFRNSVEGIFDKAKKLHDTQRAFAVALLEADAFSLSYDSTDRTRRTSSIRAEADRLLDKLRVLSMPDRSDDLGNRIVVVRPPKDGWSSDPKLTIRWQKATYFLVLLMDRFGLSRTLDHRKREIDALFDAVGATDAEREEIESRIRVLYGAIHRRWLEDDWRKQVKHDAFWGQDSARPSPFCDYLVSGWRKATSKRRKLFLQHYDLFQFKSPRQLTEEGVLGLVQTMEAHEDKVFVRTSRLNSELQEILNRAVNNERHGKFDAAIADLKSLLRRVSEASGPNAVDYADETLSMIHCYLACIYASRGEHLEEAVKLAKHALEIQDSLLARLALGWSYHRQGEVAAIEELEVAKSAATRAGSGLLPLVHLVLGDAYRDAERHQDAEEAWREGWELADDPAWKDQAELTPFEVKERANLRRELGERLG